MKKICRTCKYRLKCDSYLMLDNDYIIINIDNEDIENYLKWMLKRAYLKMEDNE